MSNTVTFEDIVTLVDLLRKKCAWCKAQDFESLTRYILEEAYETVECIQENRVNDLPDELADLLFQVVFIASIANEHNLFDIRTVITALNKKHRERSPHVFGDKVATTETEARQAWDASKQKKSNTCLNSANKAMPPLLKAEQLQKEAGEVNFKWPDTDSILEKLDEEIVELKTATQSNNHEEIEDEIGDVLFTTVCLARHLNTNPTEALIHANRKFIRRFQFIEQYANSNGLDISTIPLDKMLELWHKSKIH